MWDDSASFLAGTMNGLLPEDVQLTPEELVTDFGTGKTVLTNDAKVLHGLAGMVRSPNCPPKLPLTRMHTQVPCCPPLFHESELRGLNQCRHNPTA